MKPALSATRPPTHRRARHSTPTSMAAVSSATPVAVLKRVAQSHNLTDREYNRIVRVLGRQPTLEEVGIFGVMESEHCSYASSRPYLKQFPTQGSHILVPAGKENAGVVDLGDGLAVVFKCESHNHPSAVEPHAGAATGVGGIIRDIFTMGARPIALLNSLRFGPLERSTRSRFLLEGVVKGIADYGNSVGVPTVGGEIYFDEAYRENPLVNVMCIGIVPKKEIARGAAKGIGNPVLYVGSATGRDGLGGASFASRELAEDGEADRPAVQIGDPFTEKCLIEATLEALATGDVVGIQDMGAAGLTCSTCETASRGGSGVEIDVRRVPRREDGMSPYEILLSESQERMLLVVKQGRTAKIKRLFAKWGLNAVEIGRVTNDGRMRVTEGKGVVAEIPASTLTDGAPVYHRPTKRPRYLAKTARLSLRSLAHPKDYAEVLTRLLGSPTIANKAHVYEQYDHMVQTNTMVLPGEADASVLRLKGTSKLLAATIDGNGRYCYLNPYTGGQLAVAEAARNLVCVGARPLAVTDCLNFGSPQDPEIMWQFKECVRGIADACRAFKTPVTGGNVSFYNEGPAGAIDPTPIIGMIGVIETRQETGDKRQETRGREQEQISDLRSQVSRPLTASFKDEGDRIVLLGTTREELGGSEYLARLHHRKAGGPPRVSLTHEHALQQLMLTLTSQELIKSAHDCAEGGLAVTLAESCIMGGRRLIGAAIDSSTLKVSTSKIRVDALLFGESAGRIVISCERHCIERVEALAMRAGIEASVIGVVGGPRFAIDPWIEVPVDELNRAWRTGLPRALGEPV